MNTNQKSNISYTIFQYKSRWIALVGFIVFTLFCSYSNNQENDLTDEIVADLDSLSFEDGKAKFVKEYERLMLLAGFFLNAEEDDDFKEYTHEEEKQYKTEPITLSDKHYTEKDFKKGITITQWANQPYISYLRLDRDIDIQKGEEITHTLDTIFYKDGTQQSPHEAIYGEYTINSFNPIDSIQLAINYTYRENLRTIVISEKEKSKVFEGGHIELDTIKNSLAKFTFDQAITSRFIDSQAKTKSGYMVGNHSSSQNSMQPEQINKVFDSFKQEFGKIANDIKEDKYTSKEKFIAAVKEAVSGIEIPRDTLTYLSASYNGNIDEIHLYFAEKNHNKQFTITLPVKNCIEKYSLFYNKEEYKQGIMDDKGQIIVDAQYSYDEVSQLNDYYFSINDTINHEEIVYRIDTISRSLQKTEYKTRDIKTLGNNLLRVVADEKCGAIDNNGKYIIAAEYDYIYKSDTEDIIIAVKKYPYSESNSYILFNLNGEKIGSGIGHIYDYEDHMAMVKLDEKGFNFIDQSGKIAISLPDYDGVRDFSDNLACVIKNDKAGYIDKTGKIVIPMIYTEGYKFYNGLALVKDSKNRVGIINNKNEIIVPFENIQSFMVSNSGSKYAEYHINDKVYDASGNLIRTETEKEDE